MQHYTVMTYINRYTLLLRDAQAQLKSKHSAESHILPQGSTEQPSGLEHSDALAMMETHGWKVKVSGRSKAWLLPTGREPGAEGKCQPTWAQTQLLSSWNTAQAEAAGTASAKKQLPRAAGEPKILASHQWWSWLSTCSTEHLNACRWAP